MIAYALITVVLYNTRLFMYIVKCFKCFFHEKYGRIWRTVVLIFHSYF